MFVNKFEDLLHERLGALVLDVALGRAQKCTDLLIDIKYEILLEHLIKFNKLTVSTVMQHCTKPEQAFLSSSSP